MMYTKVKLVKCLSILLILSLMMGIVLNLFIENESIAASSTKTYTKGSSMLDNYPGYASLLDNLLAEHPNWTFTILFTGLDWDTVIKNETTATHGRNLTQKSSGEWVCSTCGTKQYETGWYCASTSAVSYYMDPRNGLFEDYIFQFENLEWVDGVYTVAGVEKILSGSFMDVSEIEYTTTSGGTATINKSYAQVIYDAAKSAGISPYHLASRILQEQGTSGSSTSKGTYSGYKGYYNFLNINATGSSDSAIITNALTYAQGKGWTDPQKAIEGGAAFLQDGYISVGQTTLYLQKFDVDDSDGKLYWHQYMTNVSAARTEGQSVLKAYRSFDSDLEADYNFVIPVFENMPTSRCALPGSESIVTQNIQVTSSSLVVYKSQSKSSTKLTTLSKGDQILRIEIGSEKTNGYIWDKVVLSDGTKGYVVSDTGFKVIDDITNCNITAVATEPGNVRNGPGTSGTTVITTLTVGQKVTIIEKGKYNSVDGYDWSRIVLSDGTQGYIVARYLEEVSDNGTTSTGKSTVKVVCDVLKLRSSPTTSGTIVAYLYKGDILTRVEENVAIANGYIWDKVTTSSGKTGYVARGDSDGAYIKPTSGSDDAITPDDLESSSSSSSLKGSGYETSGSYLTCEPDITVKTLVNKGATVKNSSGKTVTSGKIGTGYTVTYNGKTYTVVKLGDTNGDGEVKATDYMRIKNYIMGTSTLTTAQKKAADINGDGKVKATDYMKLKNYIMGTSDIEL